MKLKEREKNLVILATSVLSIMIFWLYGISPLSATLADKKSEATLLEKKVQLYRNNIKSIPQEQERLDKIMTEGTEIAKQYIHFPSQKWILANIVIPLSKQCNLLIENQSYSSLQEVDGSELEKQTVAANNPILDKINESLIGQGVVSTDNSKENDREDLYPVQGTVVPSENNLMAKYEVRIKFTGNYIDFVKFTGLIQQFEKQIILTNCEMAKRTDGKVDISCILNFYEVFPFASDIKQDPFYQYRNEGTYENRTNPFTTNKK